MTALIISPQGAMDAAEAILHEYASRTSECLDECGIAVRECMGADVSRDRVENELDQEPKVILYYGHGQTDCFISGGQTLVGVADCPKLNGKIVFGFACHAGDKLGDESIRRGAKCFFGYKKELWLRVDHGANGYVTVRRCVQAVFFYMCGTNDTSGRAYKRAHDDCTDQFDKWLKKDIIVAFCLFHNREAMTLKGDRATILPFPKRKNPCKRLSEGII